LGISNDDISNRNFDPVVEPTLPPWMQASAAMPYEVAAKICI
jgi:hypothetical protein